MIFGHMYNAWAVKNASLLKTCYVKNLSDLSMSALNPRMLMLIYMFMYK